MRERKWEGGKEGGRIGLLKKKEEKKTGTEKELEREEGRDTEWFS